MKKQKESGSKEMNARTYQEIPLAQIQASPLNPRKIFAGKKFDELVASIKIKGVLEPILVRPLETNDGAIFEIIAGERRFRASREAAEANGGIENARIPAIVQVMSDEDAFDAMTIENLQRADLTELEEARSFQMYLERKGPEVVKDLAERICIDPRYIRRRVVILSLSDEILESWDEGALSFGHLEQLVRIDDEERRNNYYKGIIRYHYSVANLKSQIDSESPLLKHSALFDKEEKRCKTCHQNTKVQRDLFGEGMAADKKIRCMNPQCYKKRLTDWLQDHWTEFREKFELKTNGFRFQGTVGYDDYKVIWSSLNTKCLECRSYVSLLDGLGDIYHKGVCIDKPCYRATYERKVDENGKNGNGSRVSWHGEHFREEFYKQRIPEVLSTPEVTPFARKQLLLLSLLISNEEAKKHFAEQYMEASSKPYGIFIEQDKLAEKILTLEETPENEAWLTDRFEEATREIILQGTTTPKVRHAVASRIGIKLSDEWLLSEAYLKKKTIKEMMEIGVSTGILTDDKARSYLTGVLGKQEGRFDACKKKELISVFLESGVDLTGRVPEEILKI